MVHMFLPKCHPDWNRWILLLQIGTVPSWLCRTHPKEVFLSIQCIENQEQNTMMWSQQCTREIRTQKVWNQTDWPEWLGLTDSYNGSAGNDHQSVFGKTDHRWPRKYSAGPTTSQQETITNLIQKIHASKGYPTSLNSPLESVIG